MDGSIKSYLTAHEAARFLGVEVETIYAYVSRGHLHSEPGGRGDRSRRYRREDVERLKLRREERMRPGRTAGTALTWGQPVLESSISCIADGALYYRGRNVLDLRDEDFETVAAFLWQADGDLFAREVWPRLSRRSERHLQQAAELTPMDRCRMMLVAAGSRDPAAYRTEAASVRLVGARLLRLMCIYLTLETKPNGSLAGALASAWVRSGRQRAESMLNAALVLMADHELNLSSFTVRCVASGGAGIYQAVCAGLAALSGPRHGLLTERTIEFLDAVAEHGGPETIQKILRRGESVPGFGHPLYPDGDPRGRALIDLCAAAFPGHAEVRRARSLVQYVRRTLMDYPTVDFGLALMCRVLMLPPGAGLAIFAAGRAAGWIAHAMEQYESGLLIRPRAKYVGVAV